MPSRRQHKSKAPLYYSAKQLESQISELDVRMNSTLKQLIAGIPAEIVQKSIDSLKGAIASGHVGSPAGFLNKVLKEAWQPNENFESKIELDLFNQWHPKAKEVGLVIGAMLVEDTQHVYLTDGKCVAFLEVLGKHPLGQQRPKKIAQSF